MITEFDGQKFKSEKERNRYCYFNRKKLQEKYKLEYNWKEILLILLPLVLLFVITIITSIPGWAILGILYSFSMFLFYKNKTIKNITLWAKNYEENYSNEIEREKRMVEEYERECNKCGKIWHSLKKDEENLIGQQKLNGLIGFSTAFSGNLATSAQANRNAQASNDRLKDLKKCPKCGSQNYSEKITRFEKKKS
ncbi:hypothetical protein M0R72_03535 [Candidatus Pacearchaeota archaeon]|jgi:hypothetical protein|nr:hypothetical protein [Candidatus Pacearchaeota archaeon]